MHTIMGSIDSNLSVEKAAKKIYEKDLNGACLTEHSSIWEKNNNQIEDIFNLYNLKDNLNFVSINLNNLFLKFS